MDPKCWLQFAGTIRGTTVKDITQIGKCILNDVHEKHYQWSWTFFKKRRNDRLAYINLYTALRLDVIEEEEIETLKQLEMKLSFDDIRLYRHLAMAKMKRENTAKKEVATPTTPQKTGGWYGWITGESTTNTQEDDWNEKMQKIYEKFEFQEETAEINFPPDSVRLKITSKLSSGSFTLREFKNDHLVDLISFKFSHLSLDQLSYPKSQVYKLAMKHVVVSEATETQSPFSKLIEAKQNDDQGDGAFFTLQFEQNPLDGRADNALSVKMLPLRVLVNPSILKKVVSFFEPKGDQVESLSRIQVLYLPCAFFDI